MRPSNCSSSSLRNCSADQGGYLEASWDDLVGLDLTEVRRRYGEPVAIQHNENSVEGLFRSRHPRPCAPQLRARRCRQRGRSSSLARGGVQAARRSTARRIHGGYFRPGSPLADCRYWDSRKCSSPDMLDPLGRRAPGRDISLRINLGFGHGHSQKTNTGGDHSKHGIWHEQLPEVLALATRLGLKITGLHMHIGSGTDLEHLTRVCGTIERCARRIEPSISTISAGNGLSIAYRPDDTRVLGIVGEKLSSHPGTALSEAATNVLLYFSTISSKVGSPRRTHGEDLASESRSSPSFVRRSRCRMSVETSPGW
jgi:hypothetical protein